MRIMTFNTQHCLNYITREIDFDVMANAINKFSPDVVGLQEMRDKGTYPEYDAQTQILSSKTGLENFYFAKAIDFDGVKKVPSRPYGNSALSKLSIISKETIIIPDPNPRTGDGYYETRCLLKLNLSNGLTVLVVHVGLNDDEKQNAVDTILKHLEPSKCVLMGDFNMTPDCPILNPLKEKLIDTADFIKGDKLTFPSDNPTIKIDYIFVSKDIKVKGAIVPELVSSDHRPIIADIDF